MASRDIFKIIVATVGLLGFGYGALFLLDGVLASMNLLQLQHTQPGYYATRGVVEMVIGLLFMKGIPPFVDLAFPLPEAPPPDNSQDKPQKDA